MVYLGTQERYFSGNLFFLILLLLFAAYFLLSYRQYLTPRPLLIALFVLIIVFGLMTYPAFLSHDIFSYLLYAKITAFYHKNPWFVLPRDFPSDPLLPYNHWPTSASRYGPTWIALSSALYYLARGNITFLMFLFKSALAALFLGNLFLLKKLAINLKVNFRPVLIFTAFNPFFIMESIVSPHTDTVMTFFALLAFLLLLRKRYLFSGFSFLLSLGAKIVSLPLGLIYLLLYFLPLTARQLAWLFLGLGFGGAAIIIARWSINPWYLFLPLTFGSLLINYRSVRYLLWSLSAAALVRYLPYFYLGYFDPHNKIRLLLFCLLLVPYGIWLIRRWRRYRFGGKI